MTTLKIGTYTIQTIQSPRYNPPSGYELSLEMATDLYNQLGIKKKSVSKITFHKYIKKYKIPHVKDHGGTIYFNGEDLLEFFKAWKPTLINYE